MKVYFIHNLPAFNTFEGMCRIMHIDNDKYDLEWDAQNPEILIASEWIYMSKKSFDDFLRLRDKAKLIVLFLGEAIEPDFNIADYVIGFSLLYYRGRYVHLPSPLSYFKNSFCIHSKNDANINFKTDFCNFIYSNRNAHPMRDKLFHIIDEYKHVDSLGRHLKNKSVTDSGYKSVIDMKRPYKFSIASENAMFDGYTSEKIWTSLNAHTVPIYFGNPLIETEINKKCFVNVNYMCPEEIIAAIKNIDNDDTLFNDMLSEPWQTDEQIQLYKELDEQYFSFIDSLFTGKLNERRGYGTHITHSYGSWFVKH